MYTVVALHNLLDTYTHSKIYGFTGNLLLNIGPTSDGMIPPLYEERLLQIGQWLSVNGESIFNSTPWLNCQNDTQNPHLWYDPAPKIIFKLFKTNRKRVQIHIWF